MKRRRNGFRQLVVVAYVLAFVAGLSSPAQSSSRGGIQGIVSDANGKPVAKASVTATNTETGVQTNRQTNVSGIFSIIPIQPGPYIVEVVASGFSRLLQKNVTVGSAELVSLNLKLTPGQESQTITVTDADRKSVV